MGYFEDKIIGLHAYLGYDWTPTEREAIEERIYDQRATSEATWLRIALGEPTKTSDALALASAAHRNVDELEVLIEENRYPRESIESRLEEGREEMQRCALEAHNFGATMEQLQTHLEMHADLVRELLAQSRSDA